MNVAHTPSSLWISFSSDGWIGRHWSTVSGRYRGIATFANKRWSNPGHTCVKEQCCTKDTELLTLTMLPHDLLMELSHIIPITVYSSVARCSECMWAMWSLSYRLPTHSRFSSSLGTSIILSSVLPTFTQHMKYHTRDNKPTTIRWPPISKHLIQSN